MKEKQNPGKKKRQRVKRKEKETLQVTCFESRQRKTYLYDIGTDSAPVS